MVRSELIAKLWEENRQLTQRDVIALVDTVFGEITEALSRGDRVELRGFGAFSTKHRNPRRGRNPRTGEGVDVDAKHAIAFRASKLLLKRLNAEKS